LALVVARQPVVDCAGSVVGFELLYRPNDATAAAPDAEQMTAQVLVGALSIGLDELVGGKLVFCNAERGVLTGETPVSLPPAQTVIEVLETVQVDDEVVAGARALVDRGFALALDDFVWLEGVEPLLELAAIVKIDVLAGTREEVAALVERCRAYDVRLLAEKVETDADVAWARELGFDLFQGYAIERPALVRGQTIAPSALARVELALSMLTEDLDLDALEETLRREPGLALQVLQLASAGADRGLRRSVRTLREALVLLGSVRMRQWVALTLLNGEGGGAAVDGLATALTRARMCELLAERAGTAPDVAFTAGLLSSLDLLLGVPHAELDVTLTIGEDLKAASFRGEGAIGALVAEVLDYERWLRSGRSAGAAPADARQAADDLDPIAVAAFAWAMPYATTLETAG
jgi:EAL and modified HD-GYP domain-containing signal transduction protein